MHKPTGIPEFREAVRQHIFPIATEFGLECTAIDERLFMFATPGLCVKVCLPEGHGYRVFINLSPRFSLETYAPGDSELLDVMNFLQIMSFGSVWCSYPEEISGLVKARADTLQQVLSHLRSGSPDLWTKVETYISDKRRAEIDRIKQYVENPHEATKQRTKESVRALAGAAWQNKDYASVVALYESIREDLTYLEVNKLEYARKHGLTIGGEHCTERPHGVP